jgi:hypothetical protein
MNAPRTRREFLTEVGQGMLVATVGYEVASELGLASALAEEAADTLSFGPLEALVCLMQETPVNRLVPTLVGKLHAGTDLRQLTAAAAFANARTFGGEDYVGFHTMMALAPAHGPGASDGVAAAASIEGALSKYQPHPGARWAQRGSAASGQTGDLAPKSSVRGAVAAGGATPGYE